MGSRNKILAMDSASAVKQDTLGIVAVLDNPESMREVEHEKDDLETSLVDLSVSTCDYMNAQFGIAPSYLFEPDYEETKEKYMICYKNARGDGFYIFPKMLDGFNGTTPEIRPAFISDGYADLTDRESVFLYIRSNFTIENQKGILQEILRWYEVNFLDITEESELCESIEAFDTAIRHALA